jgi:hypothetical protein
MSTAPPRCAYQLRIDHEAEARTLRSRGDPVARTLRRTRREGTTERRSGMRKARPAARHRRQSTSCCRRARSHAGIASMPRRSGIGMRVHLCSLASWSAATGAMCALVPISPQASARKPSCRRTPGSRRRAWGRGRWLAARSHRASNSQGSSWPQWGQSSPPVTTEPHIPDSHGAPDIAAQRLGALRNMLNVHKRAQRALAAPTRLRFCMCCKRANAAGVGGSSR